MLRTLKLTAVCVMMLFALITTAIAAPSFGNEEKVRQPDGTEVTVRIWGDEFYHRIECINGYTLVRDAERWLVYAKLSDDGNEFVSTEIRYTDTDTPQDVPRGLRINDSAVREIRHRARVNLGYYEMLAEGPKRHPRVRDGVVRDIDGISAAPIEPEVVVGLVIPVEFADVRAIHTVEEIEEFFNRPGGIGGVNPAGSIRDYFLDVSNGLMDYSNVITPIITLPHNRSYYEDRDDDLTAIGSMIITDALNILSDMNFDLSEVTTIGTNNRVRALNIFHAGVRSNSGMWPHASTYRDQVTLNGVSFGRYQISNLGTDEDLSGRLGLVIHENGHSLMNWRDLYDHDDFNTLGRGIGNWCVMANQVGFPQQPNAYLRYLAGWIDVIDITNAAPETVFSMGANSDTAYVYWRNDREAYFIEVRRNEGIRNQSLPGSGLAIWHIDTLGRNNVVENEFPQVALIQADGRNDLEHRVNRGDGTDLFRFGLRTKFDSTTIPAAIWHDGTPSTFSISGISDSGAVMSFTIGDDGSDDVMSPKYRFYNQVMFYAIATEDVEAVVDEDFTLDMLVNVPTPRIEDITLTVRSEESTMPAILTRGISGDLFTVFAGGTLVLEDVVIDGDFDDDADGALVRINPDAAFIMNDGAVVRNNVSSGSGGGVWVRGGTFTMNGGEISDNTATGTDTWGGGVRVSNATTGGITYIGAFTMNGGKITGNTTAIIGGGVGVSGAGSMFTMNAGEISGNIADVAGAGVGISGGIFTMDGGEINNNIANGAASNFGGGVRVASNAEFTMSGGKINNNTTTLSGGGVALANSKFTMTGGEISGNTADGTSGGVRVSDAGASFIMQGGKISGNTAGTNSGGVSVASGTFTMESGEISGNDANTDGGGVRVSGEGGTFVMSGGKISGNTAASNGGGVRVTNEAAFTMTGGEISGNIVNTGASGVSLQSVTAIGDINGGVVAGIGANINAVVSASRDLNSGDDPSSNNALIIVWNKPAGDGPFVYAEGSSSDLTISPSDDAVASWSFAGDILGISYVYGDNEGFIAIDVMMGIVSILASDRTVPDVDVVDDVAIINPANRLTAQFTAGPNPVSRTSGTVNFFWQGGWIDDAVLTIFDASGNVVNRIEIADARTDLPYGDINRLKPALTTVSPTSTDSRRSVGSWDLTDRNNRPISEGTYLVRGMITTSNGARERVSMILGVR
ncbi:MAG: M6 family metalloprotease domain-containing protein [Chitinispirillales bacterium]|jgi:M6 family metalloprotease-like protein|nr:M6 family metalloprotease domain-containing protein [Chitinispirillales bacterium]